MNTTYQAPSNKLDAYQIKQSINPYDFYSHELPNAPLKQDVWTNGGHCPFHDDRHTGNFRVHTGTGAFKCYSCGVSGGDVIAFIRARDGLSFPDALAKLAGDNTIISYTDAQRQTIREQRELMCQHFSGHKVKQLSADFQKLQATNSHC